MKLTIRHTLSFSLGAPIHAVQHLLLTALSTPQQRVERWSIEAPGFAEGATFRDGFGNKAHLISQTRYEGDVEVGVSGVVETFDKAGVLGRLEFDPPPALFRRPTDLTLPEADLIEGLSETDGRIAMLHELMGRVHARLAEPTQMQARGGQSQAQAAATTPTDLAHSFIGAARALNVPARYVTGYLLDDGRTSFHAWSEAWDDRLGWIGFDPTVDVCPAESHVRLACGLDAVSTMPVRSSPVWGEMPAETVEITIE